MIPGAILLRGSLLYFVGLSGPGPGGLQRDENLAGQVEEPCQVKAAVEDLMHKTVFGNGQIPAAHDLQPDDGVAQNE